MERFCITTKLDGDRGMRCGISMTLSNEEKDAWLDFLRSSGRLELFDGRHRIIIEDVPGGGEEWTAREPFSSSLLS